MKGHPYIIDLSQRSKVMVFVALVCGVVQATPAPVCAAGDSGGDLAVSSLVMRDYVRTRQADGTFQPETYVFRQGGCWAGFMRDDSFDNVSFKEVAQITSLSLAKQKYLPAKDPDQANLLIDIFWGTTGGKDYTPPEIRDRRNAMFMGYESALAKYKYSRDTRPTFHFGEDLMMEFRGGSFGRYFVVIVAYDWQLMRKERKERPLWMTRFSIPGRRNGFDEQLPAMTLAASRYFGQASNGLTHEELREGKIEIGALKSLGVVP
jgi:hypothetical protein